MVLQGPPDYFSTIVKPIYFCMVVACGGAAVHKKKCILLHHSMGLKTQSNAGDLFFEKVP